MSLNCETTQKYEALAWLTTIDPAPIAIVTSAFAGLDVQPIEPRSGAMIADVVTSDTVDDPCAVLIAAAMTKGSSSPRFHVDIVLPRKSPSPVALITAPSD